MKSGIRILSEAEGDGALIHARSVVGITHSCYLSGGEALYENRGESIDASHRHTIAGLRYGIEGMRVGGRRRFRASPHLCYGDQGLPGIVPPNAVLIFDVVLLSVDPEESLVE